MTEFDPLSPLLEESLASYNIFHDKSLVPSADDVINVVQLSGAGRKLREGPVLFSPSLDIFLEPTPPPSDDANHSGGGGGGGGGPIGGGGSGGRGGGGGE